MTETEPPIEQTAAATVGSQRRPSSRSRKILDASKPGEETQAENKNLLQSKKKRASKPAYLQSLNESEKQANFKIIDSMNKKISYLKNPRYKVNRAPILMTTVSFYPL